MPEIVRHHRFSTRDLLIIAILSGIGGVMSTYVGYLGNLLNRMLGVPFGAGQFVAGLHVFWIIIAAGLVRKPGAATGAGLLKGVVELLTGSTHGIVIVLVSLVQGAVVDVVLLLFHRQNLLSYSIAGAVATSANVFVFQILYFSGAPLTYILFIAGLAFISGLLLAGWFAVAILDLLHQARPVKLDDAPLSEKRPWLNMITSGVLVAALSTGAIYYFAAVYEPPWVGPQCRVEGNVKTPMTFQLGRFREFERTITAELKGKVTHIPAREYTGVPVAVILKEAEPEEQAAELRVVAADGYEVMFSLSEVLKDEKLLLSQEDDSLRLIAANYDGGYWVEQVTKLIIE